MVKYQVKTHNKIMQHSGGLRKEESENKPRYDLIPYETLERLAMHFTNGAKKYGDFNWQKSRLSGNKSPINHILKHTTAYIIGEPYDHPELGLHRKIHLAAVGFNAMMEFWYEENMGDKKG